MKRIMKNCILKLLNFIKILNITYRELRASIKNTKLSRRAYLEAQMLMTAHSLEKGMGIKDSRVGYGQQKADYLADYLANYKKSGYDLGKFSFIESLKIFSVYLDYSELNGVKLTALREKYNKLFEGLNVKNKEKFESFSAGYENLEGSMVEEAKKFEFDKFIETKHSIREFKAELVNRDLIIRAVNISNKAPSACNRQPVKIYCTSNLEQAEQVDNLITGTHGFKNNIQNFAVVTCDRASFTASEQYQWYINGGIYVSYFTLALHSLGIGSCIMQWFAFYKTEKQLKNLLEIKNSEAIIAIIGYGYYKDKFKCICAQRKSSNETVKFV